MLQAIVLAETLAIGLLTVLVIGLLRSHGEVLRTLHRLGAGLDTGSNIAPAAEVRLSTSDEVRVAPPVIGTTLREETVSLSIGGRHDVLLAFLSSGCDTCQAFWQTLRADTELPDGAELVIVTGDADRESESLLRRLAPSGVPLVMSSQAWSDYEVPGSPHFVYVDGATATVVGEGTAVSFAQLTSMLERAAEDRRLALARTSRPQDAPADVDAELAAAGVAAGDPRLYTDPDLA
jgi:hypothetical protein